MGVYIKGMKMPTHCFNCRFWHDGIWEHCTLNDDIQNEDVPEYDGEYPNACPLIELPPHGRLIDADDAFHVLTSYYHHRTDFQHEALKESLGRVPTILEAEESP